MVKGLLAKDAFPVSSAPLTGRAFSVRFGPFLFMKGVAAGFAGQNEGLGAGGMSIQIILRNRS